MEKQRRFKVFSIVALMFAVVALSVGFAAFQKVLNISSSADVSLPSEDNFNIELYGVIDKDALNNLNSSNLDFSRLSKEKSFAYDLKEQVLYSEYSATIDNESFTIDINNLVLKEPGDTYFYYFLLKNNSDYGVYVYLSDESKTNLEDGLNATCVPEKGTSQTLVDNVCSEISMSVVTDEMNDFVDGIYKLPAKNYLSLAVIVYYGGKDRVDGNFTISYDPIKIEFDTVPHIYE